MSKMATTLQRLKRASSRLIILAACGFARSIEHLLPDKRSRDAIEVAERFADGLATAEEIIAAAREAVSAEVVALGVGPATKAATSAATTAWAAIDAAGTAKAATWAADGATKAAWAVGKTAKKAAEATHQPILDCILPSRIQTPFPANVKGLATTIYEKRDWTLMPILADALEEMGQGEMAAHCRQPIHAKGCHVLDSILGLH
jgi:hypothetical protein